MQPPALPRNNRIQSNRPPAWTQGETHLAIDLHWLEGAGPQTIATRLARSKWDVERRLNAIKRYIRKSENGER